VATRPGVDVGEVVIHPETRKPIAVSFNRLRREWQVIDPEFADDFRILDDKAKGDFDVTSWDRDLQRGVVVYAADTHPSDYYLYDRRKKERQHLFTSRPELEKYTLAPMKPVIIRSRDGLDLPSYLTMPAGSEGGKLPLVLVVHGGPWARDTWGFDATAQW